MSKSGVCWPPLDGWGRYNQFGGLWQLSNPLFHCRPDASAFYVNPVYKSHCNSHVLICPVASQGLANRVCTIANGMMLASELQWGICIIWEWSVECPCRLADVFQLWKLYHDELRFVRVLDFMFDVET